MVAAFEQSLSNMTQRLQQLSVTADRKDGELTEMRQTIELLRKQSIQAGLTTAHMNSMNEPSRAASAALAASSAELRSIHGPASSVAASSVPQPPPPAGSEAGSANSAAAHIQRHLSSDSMCSLNSLSSGCSAQADKQKKKKGWLRSSFNKAFTRNASAGGAGGAGGGKLSKSSRTIHSSATSQCTDVSDGASTGAGDVNQLPPMHPNHHHHHQQQHQQLDAVAAAAKAASLTAAAGLPPLPQSPTKAAAMARRTFHNATIPELDGEGNPVVEDLKKQLREKDLVLTDIRLEALSSASQLESLKDTVSKMRQEMLNLKQNNERLQKMVTSRSLAGSECSLGVGNGVGGGGGPISPSGSMGEPRRYSLADGNMRPVSD